MQKMKVDKKVVLAYYIYFHNTPLRSQSRQLPDLLSIQSSQPDLLSIQSNLLSIQSNLLSMQAQIGNILVGGGTKRRRAIRQKYRNTVKKYEKYAQITVSLVGFILKYSGWLLKQIRDNHH